MELDLLGQPTATAADGRAIALPPGRPARLLAALALDTGRVLDRDALVEAVWDDSAPQSVRNALHVYVSRLRTLLGTGVIVTAGTGYRLMLPEEAIDANRFVSLTDEGVLAVRTGLVHRGIALLAEAVASYRGPLLAGEALSTSLAAARRRLAERHDLAREDLLAARLLVVSPSEAPALIAQARELVDEAPLREERHLLLLQALEIAGRRSEALDAYDSMRRLLRDRLDSAPSDDLRAVHERLVASGTATATETPELLPAPVGRAREIEEVAALVVGRRLVSVVGPAGSGTSRVADEATRVVTGDFGGRVHQVSLAGADAPEAALAAALGPTLEALVGSRSLVVLDACEDPAVKPVVQRLMRDLPDTTVLCTSQRPLGLVGEVVVRLGGLDAGSSHSPRSELLESPGVQLYLQRAREAGHTLADAEVPDVARLVRRLGGLPLTIELAAGHPDGGRPRLLLDRFTGDGLATGDRSTQRSSYAASVSRALRHVSAQALMLLQQLAWLPPVPDSLLLRAADDPEATRQAIDELVGWSVALRPDAGVPVVAVSEPLRHAIATGKLADVLGPPPQRRDTRMAVRAALGAEATALLEMPLAVPPSVEASLRVRALQDVARACLSWSEPWPSEDHHVGVLLLLLDADISSADRDAVVRDLSGVDDAELSADQRFDLQRARLGFALAAADAEAIRDASAELGLLAAAADPLRQCAWSIDRVFLALEAGDIDAAHELGELAWSRVAGLDAANGPLGVRAARARMHAARLHTGLEAGVRLALQAAALADRADCTESISAFGEAAEMLVDAGEVDLGANFTRRAARLALRWSSPHSLVYALSLADIALSRGEHEECWAISVALLERVRRLGNHRYQKWCLIRLAQAAYLSDDHKRASSLLGASSTIAPGTAWESDPDVCELLEALPAALGGAAFREAFDRGSSAPSGWVTAVLDEPRALPTTLEPDLAAALLAE